MCACACVRVCGAIEEKGREMGRKKSTCPPEAGRLCVCPCVRVCPPEAGRLCVCPCVRVCPPEAGRLCVCPCVRVCPPVPMCACVSTRGWETVCVPMCACVSTRGWETVCVPMYACWCLLYVKVVVCVCVFILVRVSIDYSMCCIHSPPLAHHSCSTMYTCCPAPWLCPRPLTSHTVYLAPWLLHCLPSPLALTLFT